MGRERGGCFSSHLYGPYGRAVSIWACYELPQVKPLLHNSVVFSPSESLDSVKHYISLCFCKTNPRSSVPLTLNSAYISAYKEKWLHGVGRGAGAWEGAELMTI